MCLDLGLNSQTLTQGNDKINVFGRGQSFKGRRECVSSSTFSGHSVEHSSAGSAPTTNNHTGTKGQRVVRMNGTKELFNLFFTRNINQTLLGQIHSGSTITGQDASTKTRGQTLFDIVGGISVTEGETTICIGSSASSKGHVTSELNQIRGSAINFMPGPIDIHIVATGVCNIRRPLHDFQQVSSRDRASSGGKRSRVGQISVRGLQEDTLGLTINGQDLEVADFSICGHHKAEPLANLSSRHQLNPLGGQGSFTNSSSKRCEPHGSRRGTAREDCGGATRLVARVDDQIKSSQVHCDQGSFDNTNAVGGGRNGL